MGRGMGGGVRKCVEVWGEAKKDEWGGVWKSVWEEWGKDVRRGMGEV